MDAQSQPEIVPVRSPDSILVNQKPQGPASSAIATISGDKALSWAFVLLVAAIIYVGWQATMAINLLNNFKANQFADLKEQVQNQQHTLDTMERDRLAEREAETIVQKLKEKQNGPERR